MVNDSDVSYFTKGNGGGGCRVVNGGDVGYCVKGNEVVAC